ncbi:hypothetical protein NDU88_003923 [Pleurodeles waltl]|uniref:Uncharacterized protein n=1 Tax=Pleurodeles waltl TaxID=8319 RepID=A0AAV7KXW4_PLEWA|nr:hypothetical protein NDU88_003923 [Pleurodeles waltl]
MKFRLLCSGVGWRVAGTGSSVKTCRQLVEQAQVQQVAGKSGTGPIYPADNHSQLGKQAKGAQERVSRLTATREGVSGPARILNAVLLCPHAMLHPTPLDISVLGWFFSALAAATAIFPWASLPQGPPRVSVLCSSLHAASPSDSADRLLASERDQLGARRMASTITSEKPFHL